MTQVRAALRRYQSPTWLVLTTVFLWYASPVVIGLGHGAETEIVQ